jgi:hypothetical protein
MIEYFQGLAAEVAIALFLFAVSVGDLVMSLGGAFVPGA